MTRDALLLGFLRSAGADHIRVEYGTKHPRAYYRWQGRERFYVVPGSPGDRRGHHNAISRLKRIFRSEKQCS
jgi:hypothetical protein